MSRCAAIAAIAVFISTACKTAHPGERIPVRLALTQSPITYLPVWMAQELGYYDDEGLAVTIDEFPGATKTMQALLGGSADVGAAAYEQVIQIDVEGRRVRAFVTMLRFGTRSLVVVPAFTTQIRRIEDLKGAHVGVASLGGPNHFVLNYLLGQHGLSAQDVNPVVIGTVASAVAAVEHNKIQAAILNANEFFLLQSRKVKIAILADTSGVEGSKAVFGVDTFPTTVLFSSDKWLDQNPETARKMAAAVRRTIHWVQAHTPEEVRQKMPGRFRMEPPESDLSALRLTIPGFSPDGEMDPGGAEAVRKVLAASLPNVRTANLNLAETYTNAFVKMR